MTNQNLPCPFCGCEVESSRNIMGYDIVYHPINEFICMIRGNTYPLGKWNYRPPHPLEKDINLRCDELTNRLNEVSTELIGAKWRSLDAEKELSDLKEKVREFRDHLDNDYYTKWSYWPRIIKIFNQIFGDKE